MPKLNQISSSVRNRRQKINGKRTVFPIRTLHFDRRYHRYHTSPTNRRRLERNVRTSAKQIAFSYCMEMHTWCMRGEGGGVCEQPNNSSPHKKGEEKKGDDGAGGGGRGGESKKKKIKRVKRLRQMCLFFLFFIFIFAYFFSA